MSLCLFDDEGAATDQHAVAQDLCGGLLVSSFLTVILLALAVLDRVQPEGSQPSYVVSPRRIDPPPKPSYLS